MICFALSLNAQGRVPIYTSKVQQSYAHSRDAYTQGLFFHNGQMFESIGQYGSSCFREVDFRTGEILRQIDFEDNYFIEGSCVLNGLVYILTWKENKCFIYDLATFNQVGVLYYPTEGWGLTTDGKDLIMSDGTSDIYFLDPNTMIEKRRVSVKYGGNSLSYLNELEYIDGKIYANVYGSDNIVIIEPEDGKVIGKIECSGLLTLRESYGVDVLNGIAYNTETKKLYITGKLWPKLFEINTTSLKK